MRKCSKWLLFVVLFIGAIFGLSRLYYHYTDDFRLANITHPNLPLHADWIPTKLSDRDQEIFNQAIDQPFFYLDKGAQSYVFQSQDGQYVLKFFKFKHLKPNFMVKYLPSISPLNHIKYKYFQRKERKLNSLFEGYRVADLYDKEHTDLIYLHLAPTDYLNQTVTVFDKIGRQHEIALDSSIFLVQKKGIALKNRLNTLLSEGKYDEAKQDIALILGMYQSEYEKGIFDRDHGVVDNTGFIGNKPFHLDVGKLTKDDQMKDLSFAKQDLELVIWKIDLWIKQHHPRYSSYFRDYFAHYYQQLTGDQLNIDQMTIAKYKAQRR